MGLWAPARCILLLHGSYTPGSFSTIPISPITLPCLLQKQRLSLKNINAKEVAHSTLHVTNGVARRASGTAASGGRVQGRGNINILNKKLLFCAKQILRY